LVKRASNGSPTKITGRQPASKSKTERFQPERRALAAGVPFLGWGVTLETTATVYSPFGTAFLSP
jgi:hypothetical protein